MALTEREQPPRMASGLLGLVLALATSRFGPALSSCMADMLPAAGLVYQEPAIEVTADWTHAQPPGSRIRLATYNIQDFLDGINDGTNRTPEQAAHHSKLAALIIEEIDPDVVVLQEVESSQALCLLNAQFHHPYPLAYLTDFARQGERRLNIAVLSRITLAGVRTLEMAYLQGPGAPPRGVLSFAIPLDEHRSLLVYGVHLKSNFGDSVRNRAKRYHAMKIVADDANLIRRTFSPRIWEMVIVGDTNVDPDDPQFADDPTFEPLAGWKDLWRGRPLSERVTVPTRYGDPLLEFPPCTFDRVFATPELTDPPWIIGSPATLQKGVDTQNVYAVGGLSDTHVSDHYPVYVDIVR